MPSNELVLPLALVNAYGAHKQHLLPSAQSDDLLQVVRDIVALHATEATTPYLSQWARLPDFQRSQLEQAWHRRRDLVKLLCMRATLHLVPSDEMPWFYQAYEDRSAADYRRDMPETLLVQAGLCQEEDAPALKHALQDNVIAFLMDQGAATTREIARAVPALQAKIRYDVGKPTEGQYSIGTGIIRAMCAQGLLVRGQPRGSWRSNQHEYAPLATWLPHLDLHAVTGAQAQAWLVRRYLAAFGPATHDDVQWWTGFTKGEAAQALAALDDEVKTVRLEGQTEEHLMLREDVEALRGFSARSEPFAALLPALDPVIMGYQDRTRFLAPEQRKHLFDRAGNAVPTVWVNGRVRGAWAQRRDGRVVYDLLEPVGDSGRLLVEAEVQRLQAFLGADVLATRSTTAFTRALLSS